MREITLTVRGDTVHASRHRAGIQGECNATALVVSFDESWDGYAKQIVFWDALEQNPVKRMLTVDLLVDVARDTRTYRTTIPGEPLALAGECLLVIEGYVDGTIARSMSVRLKVEEAPVADNAGEPADPTPDPVQQFQEQIEGIMGNIQNAQRAAESANQSAAKAELEASDAKKAKTDAQTAATSAAASEQAAEKHKGDAQSAAELAEGYTSHPPIIGKNGNWWEWGGAAYVDTGKPSRGEQGETGDIGPQGEQGERGPSGVYVGSGDMPEGYNVQVDPDAEASEIPFQKPVGVDLSKYNSEGVVVETYMDGSEITYNFEFDSTGNPVKVTDSKGNETVFVW